MPSLAVLVILGLAAYRLTRLWTADSITLPWRDMLYDWAWRDVDANGRPLAVPVPRGRHENRPGWNGGFRTWVHKGLTCQQCFGVWVGIAVYCAWRWGGDVALGILAVAALLGVQSALAVFVDAVEPEE